MNKLIIIGNLTKDPELRTTQAGVAVCSFTVAVNRYGKEADTTDYFRVTTWRELAQTCSKFLNKGKKVCCSGRVTVSSYNNKNGEARGQLELEATEVEFLSPKSDGIKSDEQRDLNEELPWK